MGDGSCLPQLCIFPCLLPVLIHSCISLTMSSLHLLPVLVHNC
ncbi:hypothetical protein MtrunA17_Chr4g0067691 [Medicago truncatula]|uniref:Uncharacterized protein n=1 Tax=Medicago truncatula TaxID=3880 RepID=A0A396IKD1_MEDTR|nr:hypothetical protein MtrunA17_Chr4g0067691 [Medicago truncatula]